MGGSRPCPQMAPLRVDTPVVGYAATRATQSRASSTFSERRQYHRSAGPDRLWARGLRLRPDGAGAARHHLHHQRRPDGGHRRAHRQRQIHRRKPHPALPRCRHRHHHDRRRAHPRLHASRAALPDRLRAARHRATPPVARLPPFRRSPAPGLALPGRSPCATYHRH
jgi:hypothetical protein